MPAQLAKKEADNSSCIVHTVFLLPEYQAFRIVGTRRDTLNSAKLILLHKWNLILQEINTTLIEPKTEKWTEKKLLA